jgi:hypothetical protein
MTLVPDPAAAWSSLTGPQRAALRALGRGSLGRVRAGWGQIGHEHTQGTILALVRRGLAEPRDWAMRITPKGRQVLEAAPCW